MTTTPNFVSFLPADNPRMWDCVGAVDDALEFFAAAGGQLAYRATWVNGEPVIVASSPNRPDEYLRGVRTGYLRAFMARIAKIASDDGNEFLPYGGRVEFERFAKRFRAEFVNTPAEQWLTLTRLPDPSLNGHCGERPGV